MEALNEIEQNSNAFGTLVNNDARFHVTNEIQLKSYESIRLNEVAEIILAYRPKIKASQRPKVTCSRQVYEADWSPDFPLRF